MSKCDKLLTKAKASSKNFRFDDLCKLAECHGWTKTRQEGSHCMYENNSLGMEQGRMMNFQNRNGLAKPYQVKQMLDAIDHLMKNAK